MSEYIRTNDRKTGTLIIDLDTHRAIVYQVGREWRIRVGARQAGLIAPTEYCPDCFCGEVNDFGTKKAAIIEAEHFLEQFRHLREDEV